MLGIEYFCEGICKLVEVIGKGFCNVLDVVVGFLKLIEMVIVWVGVVINFLFIVFRVNRYGLEF